MGDSRPEPGEELHKEHFGLIPGGFLTLHTSCRNVLDWRQCCCFFHAFPEPQAGIKLVEDQIALQELWLRDWHLLRLWINPCGQGRRGWGPPETPIQCWANHFNLCPSLWFELWFKPLLLPCSRLRIQGGHRAGEVTARWMPGSQGAWPGRLPAVCTSGSSVCG